MQSIDLKDLIAKGKIQETLDHLRKNVGEEFLDEVILLDSRYSANETKNSRGVIAIPDYQIEINRISESLINLINGIEKIDSLPKRKPTGNWRIDWIKERYPNSIVKEVNELPRLREFANKKLDFRVILPQKFDVVDGYPYSEDIGINFAKYDDSEKIQMSIELGIDLILLGGMKLFVLAIEFLENTQISEYEVYKELSEHTSSYYNSEKTYSRFKIEIIKIKA